MKRTTMCALLPQKRLRAAIEELAIEQANRSFIYPDETRDVHATGKATGARAPGIKQAQKKALMLWDLFGIRGVGPYFI